MKTSKTKAFALLTALLIAAALAIAESDQQNAPLVETKEVLTTLEQRMQKRISVNFRATPIDDVIRIMAEQADVDIVKSPKVVGDVTTTLTDVPLSEALTNILAAHGYGYVTTKNMIRIAPLSDITERAEVLTDRIYTITYADVEQVEKALKKFLSSRGSISSNKGTGNLIVTDTESKIKAIDKFIQEIDRVTPQVLVEVRIYDVVSKDRLDLGLNWQVATRTVFTGGVATGGVTNPFLGGIVSSTIDKAGGTGRLRYGVLDDHVDIDVLLTAEQEDVCATLLANPRILVLDNETALFKSVSEIPYQEVQESSAGGVIGKTAFREVGVTLSVIPHVARDGMIRLRVMPEFSIATGDVAVGGYALATGEAQPVVDSRNADTTLLIKDGQTVALGGLRKKEINTQVNKVPLLGDIPVVGAAFRFEGEETVNSELVVFITPRIVLTPGMSELEREQYQFTEFQTCSPQCASPKVDRCQQ